MKRSPLSRTSPPAVVLNQVAPGLGLGLLSLPILHPLLCGIGTVWPQAFLVDTMARSGLLNAGHLSGLPGFTGAPVERGHPCLSAV